MEDELRHIIDISCKEWMNSAITPPPLCSAFRLTCPPLTQLQALLCWGRVLTKHLNYQRVLMPTRIWVDLQLMVSVLTFRGA